MTKCDHCCENCNNRENETISEEFVECTVDEEIHKYDDYCNMYR